MVTEAVTKSVPRYCSTVDLNIFSYILRDKTVIKIIKYNTAFIVVLFPFYKRRSQDFFYIIYIVKREI